ncbi:MAG: hypothetical protein LBQ79_08455 [Deltaproteobacteria bacterium]|nr:hypothetical protein [Deltaproteobacteria bacterium]
MPEPTGRIVCWPLLAPWIPPRAPEAGFKVFYLSFPSWERHLAAAGEGGAAPDGLPLLPLPRGTGAEPLLAPDPPNFLAALASLWKAVSEGGSLGGALPFPGPGDPADSVAAIRRSILAGPVTCGSGKGAAVPPVPARAGRTGGRLLPGPPTVTGAGGISPRTAPPELVLALWTLGAAAGREADMHLREAARLNSALLDALKGPLAFGDAGELDYEAEGLSGLEEALAEALGPAWDDGEGPEETEDPGGPGEPAGRPEAGGASGFHGTSGPAGTAAAPGPSGRRAAPPPASAAAPAPADASPASPSPSPFRSEIFRAPPASPANAALLRDMWLTAARPLLRAGDRLTATGSGFEGLMEGLFAPDPQNPGDCIYADI